MKGSRSRRIAMRSSRRRRVATTRCVLAAIVTVGLCPAAAFAADVTDVPASAPDLVFGPGLIDRPGDHDWFAVRSRRPPGQSKVGVRVTSTNPSCPGAEPLLISVHNPELSWMRTIPVPAAGGRAYYDLPATGARYLIAIVAADPACVGLQYEILPGPPRGTSTHFGANAGCRIATGQWLDARNAVAKAKQARDGAKKSRKRKNHELTDAKTRLAAALKHKNAKCPK